MKYLLEIHVKLSDKRCISVFYDGDSVQRLDMLFSHLTTIIM